MRLNTSLLSALLCVPAAGSAQAPITQPFSIDPNAPPTAAQPAFFDAEIAGILEENDRMATELATMEVEFGGASEARSFASAVSLDRLDQVNKLGLVQIAMVDGETAARLRREKIAALSRLKALKGRALDRAYISVAIDGLSAEIAGIDKRFLSAATAPALVAHLRQRRQLLALHLERARLIKTLLAR